MLAGADLAAPTSTGERGRGCGGRRSSRTWAIVWSESGGRSAAEQFSSTCAGRLAPGIAQVTASFIRIQRSANVAMVAPAGTSGRSSSTASRPASKSTPEKVSPRSKASPWRLKARWSSRPKVLARRHLARQHPRRQRQARQDADLAARGLGEEQLGRALAEDVVDDLHRLHAGELDGLQRLLDPLDADAVEAELARLHQIVEHAEDLGLVVDVGGRAVELQQVEGLDLQILQAALDEGGQVRRGCSRRRSAWASRRPALVAM